MLEENKREGPPENRKDRLKRLQERIEKSGFKVIEGDKASPQADESPASFRFSDEFFKKKPLDPKAPGMLDEGQ